MKTKKVIINDDNILCCPQCGNDYIHQSDEVFLMQNVMDQSGSIPLITKADMNKNYRRIDGDIKLPYRGNSIAVKFCCELCDNTSFLYISQHKGNTHIDFILHDEIK
jgi:hypothetical protein